jgi:serine/threonine protein kinase
VNEENSCSFLILVSPHPTMLPQLNVSSGSGPGRNSRVGSNGSFSCSDGGSVGQASSSSSKFEEAMEMYHQSRAIRRRKVSMSGASPQSLHSSGNVDSATLDSSASLRGPQLRPSTRLTRVQGSIGSLAQPRPGYRLPTLVSQPLPPLHFTPASASTSISRRGAPLCCSSNNTSASADTAPPTTDSHRTHSSGGTSTVPRRSTRRPLSRNRPLSPLASATVASWDRNVATTRSDAPPSINGSTEAEPRRLSCLFGSGDGAAAAPTVGAGAATSHHADSVLDSSLHQLTRSLSDKEVLPATKHPSILHSHGSSSTSYQNSTATTQVTHQHGPEKGAKSEALSQDPSVSSYDVLSLDSVLMASQDDLAPLTRLSLYTLAQPRKPTIQTHQKPQQQQKSASRPTSANPPPFSLPSDSSAVSTSLLMSEPRPSPSAKAAATAAAALPPPPSAPACAVVPLPSNSASLDLHPLRSPAAVTTTALKPPSARSTSNTAGTLTRHKADTTVGHSVSQAGLSSAVNNSESKNGSGVAGATSRRDSITNAGTPSATVMGETSSASPNSTNDPSECTGTPADGTAKTAADRIDMLPVPGAPAPGLTPMNDKQTAQFYNTASLAKTYDGSQFLNDYILLSDIGSGATGRVVLAFSTSMMCSVAIKIILKPKERKYRLQRSRCLSDSSLTSSNTSERRNGAAELDVTTTGGGGDGGVSSQHQQKNASLPVPPNGRYGEASSNATSSTARHGTAPPPPRRKGVSSTRLTTAERMTRNLQREIDVMKDLNHPNIVRLYEVINDPKANSLFLILQYVDSGAIAQLNSSGCIASPFTPEALLPIATQVIDGLVYLHEHRIVHRDIKPENILVNRDGQAFLADFGVAELMNAESGLPTAATLAYQGTPLFMAPEIYMVDDDDDAVVDLREVDLNDDSPESRKAPLTTSAVSVHGDRRVPVRGEGRSSRCSGSASMTASGTAAGRCSPRTIDPYALDVWALGVTFYTLLVGHVPFSSMLQIRQTIHSGVDVPQNLPEAWRTILHCTMEPDVSKRISATQLKQKLHAMLDATPTKAASTARRDVMRGRARGPSRPQPPPPHQHQQQQRPAAVTLNLRSADEEDVILGSGTPVEEAVMCADEAGRMVDDFDDFDCNFSINSSIMDVLRPVRH